MKLEKLLLYFLSDKLLKANLNMKFKSHYFSFWKVRNFHKP